MLLGLFLMALNQLTGINTVMYYGVTILERVGFKTHDAIWLGALCDLVQTCGVVISVNQMDGYGRRHLALRSCCLVAVALLLLSAGFHFKMAWVSVGILLNCKIKS